MTSSYRMFQAAGGGRLDLSRLIDSFAATFVVVTGSRHLERREQLDTFDGRVHAAGLVLDHRVTVMGASLVLSRLDGDAIVAVPVTNLRAPAFADALPAGPLRDAIGPLIQIRALTIASSEKRHRQVLDLRNSDAKTVARVEIDEPATAPSDHTAEAPRLTVHRLRGYDQEARSVIAVLATLGAQEIERPEPVPAVPRVRTSRSTPATDLLRTALGTDLATLRSTVPGVIDDIDTEFLHDFRVAVRRTRATLKLGRPCLPQVMRQRWEPAFKELGNRTTPVRDLDVYELDLPSMGGWLVAAKPADLQPFAHHLRERREAEHRTLIRYLRSPAFEQLLTSWDDELAGLGDPRDGPGGQSAGKLADGSIARALRRVMQAGALITVDSPAESLHTLRKDCKNLRYALTAFSPVLDRAQRRKGIGELKVLQDVLGCFQDSEVERQALHGFAEEMMVAGVPASAILAMGELIGHLDAEQHAARRQFDEAFSHFARQSNQRMMRRLGGLG